MLKINVHNYIMKREKYNLKICNYGINQINIFTAFICREQTRFWIMYIIVTTIKRVVFNVSQGNNCV